MLKKRGHNIARFIKAPSKQKYLEDEDGKGKGGDEEDEEN